MSTSAVRRKVKSSRTRNDNGMWGYQPSSFSNSLFQKMKKDVEKGIIPKSALNVNVTIMGRKPARITAPKAKGDPAKIGAKGIMTRVARSITGIFNRKGSRGSE